MSDEYLQNDPDRAGGLIADAHGEFVRQEPGGAFDPRAFRDGGTAPRDEANGGTAPGADVANGGTAPGADVADGPAKPPMDGERMVGPGEEAAKAG